LKHCFNTFLDSKSTMDAAKALAAAPAEPVVFKKRAAKSNFRKLPARDDSDSSAYSSSEDESGHRIKRRKRNTGAITASSRNRPTSATDLTPTIYTADRSGII
jgi:RING finger protein 113A